MNDLKDSNCHKNAIFGEIKSSETLRRFLPLKGMALVDPDKGATAFVTFSSPTKSHRAAYRFFYDAFTVIDIKETFNDWTLTLFNQDVREKLGIKKIATFNLISGELVRKKTLRYARLRPRLRRATQDDRVPQKAPL